MTTTTDTATTYRVVIQDEGTFTHVEYTDTDTLALAMTEAQDLVLAMEGTKVADALADATADLDMDGHALWAAWYTLPGSDVRSLVAIVKVQP